MSRYLLPGHDWRLVEEDPPISWLERATSSSRVGRLEALLPPTFEAYARILHPFEHRHRSREPWRDVAARSGRTVDASSNWMAIAQADPHWRASHKEGMRIGGEGPAEGNLPMLERIALFDVLRGMYPTTTHTFFGVWDGFNEGERMYVDGAPRAHVPQRDYVVFEGGLYLLLRFDDGAPNIWWDSERTFCVATDVDPASTYAGGSRALIDAILSSDTLEAFEVAPDAPIDP